MTNRLGPVVTGVLVLFLMVSFMAYAKTPETIYIETEQPTIAIAEPIVPDVTIEIVKTLSEEELLWQKRYEEYPIATEVWLYMENVFGWEPQVCAGVMGNIMAEIGGGTLDFSDWHHEEGPYGICQWLGGRKKSIKEIYGEKVTVEEQLSFMYDELYGRNGVRQQVTDAQREKILSAKTPQKAARYFCIWFERPNGGSGARERFAKIAYKYFVD